MAQQKTMSDGLDRWQRQMAGRDWSQAPEDPSDRIAIGTMAPRANPHLVDVRNLTLVLLHYDSERSVILRGFGGVPVPWGVKWGGPELSRFEKDLKLAPAWTGCGRRINLHQQRLLQSGLELDRRLWQSLTSGDATSVSPRIRLPNLWAAFEPHTASRVFGDGPELEALCRKRRKKPAVLFEQFRRGHRGLVLLPLNWVSHHWEQFVRVFADRARFPRCQIVHAPGGPAGTAGLLGRLRIRLSSDAICAATHSKRQCESSGFVSCLTILFPRRCFS